MQENVIQLLKNGNFAQLGTVNFDHSPHIDTVWIAYQNKQVIVATSMLTKKAKNLASNPASFMVVTNRLNPYEQAQLTLRLDKILPDNELSLCDQIADKYTGRPFPQRRHKQRVALIFNILKVKYHVATV